MFHSSILSRFQVKLQKNLLRVPRFEVSSKRIEQKHLKPQHICALELEAGACTKEAMVYKDPSNERRPIKKSCSLLLIHNLPFSSSLCLSFCLSSSSGLLLITFNPVSQRCQNYHLGSSPRAERVSIAPCPINHYWEEGSQGSGSPAAQREGLIFADTFWQSPTPWPQVSRVIDGPMD